MKKLWNKYSYAIILISLSCVSALLLSLNMDSSNNDKFLKVTVSEGDSLWKIADQYTEDNSLSKEQFVSWVKKHNEMSGDQIFPGQKLVVPVKEEVFSSGELASAAGE